MTTNPLPVHFGLALTFALVFHSGCGSSKSALGLPATVPVSGVVQFNGKPLASASVTFVPREGTKGTECTGSTDEAGKYQLQQYRGGAGAPPGDYTVVINHYVGPGGKPLVIGPGAPPPADQGAVESLPERYSSALATQLQAKVPPEGGQFDFDLKGK